jgi:hypothetical protein
MRVVRLLQQRVWTVRSVECVSLRQWVDGSRKLGWSHFISWIHSLRAFRPRRWYHCISCELRAPITLWRSEPRIPERRWPEIYYRQYTKPVAALDSPSDGIAYSGVRVHNVVNSGSRWATDWETLLYLIYLRIGETFAINASWIVYSCHAVWIVVYTAVTRCYPILDWNFRGPFGCLSAMGSDFASY